MTDITLAYVSSHVQPRYGGAELEHQGVIVPVPQRERECFDQ